MVFNMTKFFGNALLLSLIIILPSLSLSAENTSTENKTNTSQISEPEVKKIIWTGCGITKKAFMAEIAAAYKQKFGVTIELRGGGATKGIRSAKSGESHLGGTCRIPMHTPEEESMLLKLILVAWDALVVIVNKDTPITDIKKQELVDILEGKITYWNELSGWQGDKNSKEEINLYTRRSKISGVGYSMRKMLFNDLNKEFVSNKYFHSSGPLEKAIEKDKSALGVTGISSARKRNVKILSLDGIKPDYETIKSGHYTLYRPLYLTYTSLYKLPKAEKKEVRRFLDFIKSDEAAQIIRENNVVPFKDGFRLMKYRKDIFGN